MRDSIIFYRSFYEAIKELPNDIQGEVYSAIFEYSLNFNQVAISGLSKTIFTLIKPQLDANIKRFENGKKGGRKSKTEITEIEKEPKHNQKETKEEANNNNNVNDNVINTPNGVGNSPELPLPDLKVKYKAMEKTKPSIFNFIKNEKPNFIEPFADFWNLFADEHKLPRVFKINETRKKKFNLRIRDPIFNIPEILRKANTSQFILTSNWFTFDWIIENETNFLKVLEGNYDSKQKADAEQPENKLNALIKEAAARN